MAIAIKKKNLFYVSLSIILILIAGFRAIGWANDTFNYYRMVVLQDEMLLKYKEIALKLIIFLNTLIFSSNFNTFLLIFAILGVSIKIYALVRLSPLPLLSIMLYLLSYYWLHEYIQIRAGVATGIFLLATKDLAINNIKGYFFKTFLALMFHWSSIIMIPLYFLTRFKRLVIYTFLPAISILLYLIGFTIYPLTIYLNEFYIYHIYAGYKDDINVFNLISLSYILIFYIVTLVFFLRKRTVGKYEITLYKIVSVGIATFFIVSTLNSPVVSFRLLEYFMVVLLILIPYLITKFKQKLLLSFLAIAYYAVFCYYLFTHVIEFDARIHE